MLQSYRFPGLEDAASTTARARRELEPVTVAADGASGDVLERTNASQLLDSETPTTAVRTAVRTSPRSFAPLG